MTPENDFDQKLTERLAATNGADSPPQLVDARIRNTALQYARRRRIPRLIRISAIAASLIAALVVVTMNESPQSDQPSQFAFISAETLAEMALGMLVSPAYAAPDLPPGWGRAGSAPDDYEMGVTREAAHSGSYGAFIRSLVQKPSGFGTLMQTVAADQYRGKRIQLTAFMKSDITDGKLQMWMRVDMPNRTSASFDNMYDRPVTGKTDWQPYSIVLDVPNEAVAVAFGFFLNGAGVAYADQFSLGVVDKTVPVTGGDKRPIEPVNLDFES